MSAATHFFIPMDELEDHELTSSIGAQLGSLLAGMVGLHLLGDFLHFLEAVGCLQLTQRPSGAECALATRIALANGSLAATPLGDRRGVWVPISWLPEPRADFALAAAEPDWKARALARPAPKSIWSSLDLFRTSRSPSPRRISHGLSLSFRPKGF